MISGIKESKFQLVLIGTIFILICLLLGVCLAFVLYKKSWRIQSDVYTLSRIELRNIAIDLAKANEKVTFKSGSLSLAGELFYRDKDPGQPGIILLHGSSPWGKDLPLYQILSREFVKNGFVVFLFDLRGFNDSDDPLSLTNLNDLHDMEDVYSALKYFTRLKMVDADNITLIGHSYGAGLAINAAADGIGVKKVVSIAPPRRLKGRWDMEHQSFRERYSRDRKLDTLIPVAVFHEFSFTSCIDEALPYFSSAHHRPLFLIDGGLENIKDRQFLQNYFEQMVSPKKYLTMKKTDHYFNTLHLFGSNLLIYDKKQIKSLVNSIVTWLQKNTE